MFGRVHMPALDGATGWLNTEPLGPDDLRGHVVLVDFWTLTCINWLRTAPYVWAWAQAYRDDGLIVIGVHTPEFSFEHDLDLVRRATCARGIDHPVAVDDDFAIWSAFANHYWPALYTVDADGIVSDYHPGEGNYAQSERVVQRLLGVERGLVAPTVEGVGVEAPADWPNLRSPETYLGYEGGERFASPGGVVFDGPGAHAYVPPRNLRTNRWALTGDWAVEREKVVLGRAGGSIVCRFHARDAHLVLSPGSPAAPGAGSPEPIPFRVSLDGEPPGPAHGLDVDGDGRGEMEEGRLYQLVRQDGDVRKRTLEITFLEPGAVAYVFTFG